MWKEYIKRLPRALFLIRLLFREPGGVFNVVVHVCTVNHSNTGLLTCKTNMIHSAGLEQWAILTIHTNNKSGSFLQVVQKYFLLSFTCIKYKKRFFYIYMILIKHHFILTLNVFHLRVLKLHFSTPEVSRHCVMTFPLHSLKEKAVKWHWLNKHTKQLVFFSSSNIHWRPSKPLFSFF